MNFEVIVVILLTPNMYLLISIVMYRRLIKLGSRWLQKSDVNWFVIISDTGTILLRNDEIKKKLHELRMPSKYLTCNLYTYLNLIKSCCHYDSNVKAMIPTTLVTRGMKYIWMFVCFLPTLFGLQKVVCFSENIFIQ